MADNTFKLRIVTPDRIFFEGEVTMVEFNTTEGEVGVYKNHVPTTAIIKPGTLTITTEEGVKNAALHAGFVEILKDSVTILAELVEWPDEIDIERAEKAKTRAEERISQKADGMDMIRAELALQKAIARISSVKM